MQVAQYVWGMGVGHNLVSICGYHTGWEMCNAVFVLAKEQITMSWKSMHKFFKRVETVQDALLLDKWNDITIWLDFIVKEMKNIQVAFNATKDNFHLPVG